MVGRDRIDFVVIHFPQHGHGTPADIVESAQLLHYRLSNIAVAYCTAVSKQLLALILELVLMCSPFACVWLSLHEPLLSPRDPGLPCLLPGSVLCCSITLWALAWNKCATNGSQYMNLIFRLVFSIFILNVTPTLSNVEYTFKSASQFSTLRLLGSARASVCASCSNASCPEDTPANISIESYGWTNTTNTTVVTSTSEYNASATGFEKCQNRLALTSPGPNQAGAAWASTPQTLSSGFCCKFSFRIAYPSRTCTRVDRQLPRTLRSANDLSSEVMYVRQWADCATAGGDGFAFLLAALNSTDHLGSPGSGLGYQGVPNSVAVEFDTLYNAHNSDPPQRHLSIHTGGPGARNTADHRFRLATVTESSQRLPNFADGFLHNVTINYDSRLREEHVASWDATYWHASRFLTPPLGILQVFVDGASSPALSVPLNMAAVMSLLSGGRAYVGFTAATGSSWQSHDIFSWAFIEAACADV
mmetsp:Transcript_26911/g.46377  ORF Transcript_26911/g.46377 Transcript_26911/m.46377 type:complete len:475 (+) Transcript_26911:196-1620(+)